VRSIAKLLEKDRRDLFRAASQKMGVHEAIIEKDFWVCWLLDILFHDSPWKERMAFKGGTSLSKAYHAIERFSEDIDLILDWRLLGYSLDSPWEQRSANQQDRFGKEANQRTTDFLASDLVPGILPMLANFTGDELGVSVRGQDVFIRYPKAFSLGSVQPEIRLEIGPMAGWTPNAPRIIRPYAADYFPKLFIQAETSIRTILAERSFWEKATILHQEAQRSAGQPLPPRYSRHYYDLYRLSLLPIREQALARTDLLVEVVRFKMQFYRCPWARYEEAVPGSLRLLPPEHHVLELKKDYQAMRTMLFGDIPGFDEIMAGLAALEKAINKR
jgi:hypothetical protein